jgi:SAM-dependent methyltransferase
MHTDDRDYAMRLARLQGKWWKKFFRVQLPYQYNLLRLKPGFVLDVGCGIGRNLEHVRGCGVGIDHNSYAVDIARSRGFRAFTSDGFLRSEFASPGRFDSVLLSHVVEHMSLSEAEDLLRQYLEFVRPGGKVILMSPQEAGFDSDPTHVEFIDFRKLADLSLRLGLRKSKAYSFPFPRFFGKIFKYNEFVWVGIKEDFSP